MAELSLSLPVVGEKDTTAEPKVGTALSEIQTQFNGKIAAVNLEAGAVTEPKIEAALREKLGLSRGKSIIATEQNRENVAYGTLATPDEVEVVLPENGLIAIWYQATWKSTTSGAGRATIFIGANQLKVAEKNTPQPVEPGTKETFFQPLSTQTAGMASGQSAEEYGSDVTTGQVIGALSAGSTPSGPCYVFAAAGTYKVTVQFKASAGKVIVKNRKLWAEAKAF